MTQNLRLNENLIFIRKVTYTREKIYTNNFSYTPEETFASDLSYTLTLTRTRELNYIADIATVDALTQSDNTPLTTDTYPDTNDEFTWVCETFGGTSKEIVCKLLIDAQLDNLYSQFLDKSREIALLLAEQYPKLNPTAHGFSEWYVQYKYEPYLRSQRHRIFQNISRYSKVGAPTFLIITYIYQFPLNADLAVKHEDLQEYCSYLMYKLTSNYLRLQKTYSALAVEQKQLPEILLIKTFDWLGTEAQFQKLYDKMQGSEINCSYETFRGIFKLGSFSGPVLWIGKINKLVVFLKVLQNNAKIAKPEQQDLKLIEEMFRLEDDSLLNYDSIKSYFNSIRLNDEKLSASIEAFIKDLSSIISFQ